MNTKTKPPTAKASSPKPITDTAPFHDWTQHTYEELAQYDTCSPNLQALADEISPRHGLTELGCRGVRPIRGGTRPSAHAAGSARDLRYMPAMPDLQLRERIVNVLIPWLILHHVVLGIQAIHDYYGCRIWRAGRGWKAQTPSATGMGQRWAGYLHIETHPNAWANGTPIADRFGLASDDPWPPFDPAHAQFGLYPLDKKKATIKRGSKGELVQYAQAIVGAVPDGAFGPQTDMLVKVWQTDRGLQADGIIGPKTWKAIDAAALALAAPKAAA